MTDEVSEGACEHGCENVAPPGKRFCSDACARCENESESEEGCDGICRASACREHVIALGSIIEAGAPDENGVYKPAEQRAWDMEQAARWGLSPSHTVKVWTGLTDGRDTGSVPPAAHMAKLERCLAFVRDVAEGDCSYGDDCPVFGSRHGRCESCKARDVLTNGARSEPCASPATDSGPLPLRSAGEPTHHVTPGHAAEKPGTSSRAAPSSCAECDRLREALQRAADDTSATARRWIVEQDKMVEKTRRETIEDCAKVCGDVVKDYAKRPRRIDTDDVWMDAAGECGDRIRSALTKRPDSTRKDAAK